MRLVGRESIRYPHFTKVMPGVNCIYCRALSRPVVRQVVAFSWARDLCGVRCNCNGAFYV